MLYPCFFFPCVYEHSHNFASQNVCEITTIYTKWGAYYICRQKCKWSAATQSADFGTLKRRPRSSATTVVDICYFSRQRLLHCKLTMQLNCLWKQTTYANMHRGYANKLKLFGMEMSGKVQVRFCFWKGYICNKWHKNVFLLFNDLVKRGWGRIVHIAQL